jgi:hypothetical protein
MLEMPINSPLPNDTRSKLADWAEVSCLSSPRKVASRGDLLGVLDLIGEEERGALDFDNVTGEELEEEILENERAAFANAVLDELQFRGEILGPYYPFELHGRGERWRLSRKPQAEDAVETAAQACYDFCLLVSAIRDGAIQGTNLDPIARSMPNHFQWLAVEAAADVVSGNAYSFGFPRENGVTFLQALVEMTEQIRIGKPLANVPLWSNGKEKDAGIDVIAWRDFPDLRAGKLVLIGQVASGNDWIGKSVTYDAPSFLSEWFSPRPTEHFVPAIFIPFPQHHKCEGRQDAEFEVVAREDARHREVKFGLVIDRLRIVGAVAHRIAEDHSQGRAAGIERLTKWTQQALTIARAAA